MLNVIITFAVLRLCYSQHVFEEISTCEYQSGKSHLIFQNAAVSFGLPDRKVAYASFCGPLAKQGCATDAVVCIPANGKSRPPASIQNLGKYFKYNIEQDNKKVLKSISGQRCTRGKNYTITFHLECQDYLKREPVFLTKTNCEYQVAMLDPSCSPKCSTRIGSKNYFLDLQTLEEYGSISVPSDNGKFYISVCGPAPKCSGSEEDSKVTVCKIEGSKTYVLGDLSTQHVNYDSNDGVLSVRAHSGNKRNRTVTELFLNCKWGTFDIKARYIKPQTQGKNYKFYLESQHFCVKMPTNCLVRNKQYLYNINSLHRKDNQDQWTASDQEGNIIMLNVCGPLRSDYPGTCREQHSQVCLLSKNNSITVNLGSIATHIDLTDKDTVKLVYRAGSSCAENETYSTEIEFICSDEEKGPRIVSSSNCKYSITWYTPAACPMHLVEGFDNCYLAEENGYIRNISRVHTSRDRVLNIRSDVQLRYNLCGPLNRPCAGENMASVCLVRNGRETIAGWNNKRLVSRNGNLKLELKSSQPQLYQRRITTTVYFYCDHSAPVEGRVSFNNTRDLSDFTLIVHTPLACLANGSVDCTIAAPHCKFDLSPLSVINANYVVRDGTDEYIINVCRPIINTNDNLCPVNSAVCLKRNSEPHLNRRYMAFGSVARPVWENNELVIRNTNGGYCRQSEMFETSSTIRFKCPSQQQPQIPKLTKKDNCSVEFLWYTQYACSNYCQYKVSSSSSM